MSYIVGIDEVGRGPLAGPVTVGAVMWVSKEDPYTILRGIKDSKKLNPKKREEWHIFLRGLEKEGHVRIAVCSVSAPEIDKKGIMSALRYAAGKALKKLRIGNAKLLSDYGLPIPLTYKKVEHIIKGDEKEVLIAAASIVAKVHRDTLMHTYEKERPEYGFAKHKGYGTKEHRDAIRIHGPTTIHRHSFIKNILLG